MYKLSFSSFAALGSLFTFAIHLPASAVDYLQCREMLRTKNEMISIARAKDDKYLESSVYPKCPDKDKSGKEYTSRFSKTFDCLMKEKVVKTSVGTFYSPEGIRFAKSAERVAADMRKGKCPYE